MFKNFLKRDDFLQLPEVQNFKRIFLSFFFQKVAETIVLPTKNTADRLDFTKHWLTGGEISVWAEGPPKRGDLVLGVAGTVEVKNLIYSI